MTIDLTAVQIEELERCLEDFCAQSGASFALLSDETGQAVAACGETRNGDFAALAALAAANLAATVAIAGQVGEHGSCHDILYEGDRKRIYIAAGAEGLVLLIVTDSQIPIGAVRFFLQQVRKNLEETVRSSSENREDSLLGQDFDLETGFQELFGAGPGMGGFDR